MSRSSYSDNGSPIHSFPMIPKEYEQYNSQEPYTAQRQYFAQEQYIVAQQSYQLRNSHYLNNFSNQQHQVANQNNYQVRLNPVMPQQPRIYPFENQMMAYTPRQNGQSPYEVFPAVTPPVANAGKPKSAAVKRVRTQYTSEQLMQLESEFTKGNYLNRTSRIRLSQELKLTEKQIKVWFQNRRMKNKKENSALGDRNVSSSHSAYRSNGGNNISPEYPNAFQVPASMQVCQQSPSIQSISTSTHDSLSTPDLNMPTAIRETVEELDIPTILLDDSFSILGFVRNPICDNQEPSCSDSSPNSNDLLSL